MAESLLACGFVVTSLILSLRRSIDRYCLLFYLPGAHEISGSNSWCKVQLYQIQDIISYIPQTVPAHLDQTRISHRTSPPQCPPPPSAMCPSNLHSLAYHLEPNTPHTVPSKPLCILLLLTPPPLALLPYNPPHKLCAMGYQTKEVFYMCSFSNMHTFVIFWQRL